MTVKTTDGKLVPAARADLSVHVPNPWDYRAQVVGEIACWQPPLVSADRDIEPGFELAKARGRDLALTNPFVANSAEVTRDAIIGRNFALALSPDADFLGVSAEAADEWQRLVEAEWYRYAEGFTFDVDATRKSTFTFLMHQVQIGMHIDGEVLAIVRAKEGPVGYMTCLQLVEPERLDRHQEQAFKGKDGREVRFGVERDDVGEPVAYHILDGHPSDMRWRRPGASEQARRIERYGENYRPQVLHVFDETRPQMTRGVSNAILATAKASKMLSIFSEAELSRQIQSAS
ncbi:MAG: phage portal protein, partial [Hyphomicrobiaceae bacterium]